MSYELRAELHLERVRRPSCTRDSDTSSFSKRYLLLLHTTSLSTTIDSSVVNLTTQSSSEHFIIRDYQASTVKMMDPIEVLTKSNILVPTSSSYHPHVPLPTVVPGSTPIYQSAGQTGHRTLWYLVKKLCSSSLGKLTAIGSCS